MARPINLGGFEKYARNSAVECGLYKAEVIGSNPIGRNLYTYKKKGVNYVFSTCGEKKG